MNADMPPKRGDDGDTLKMPELKFTFELRDTSRLLLGALKTRIAAHDLTLAHYFLMRQLWEQEGITQAELSARLQMTQAASVPTIDALEKRGLLKRVRGDADRRVTRIYLTAKGKTMRSKLLNYASAISIASLEGFTRRQTNTLRSLLADVRANLTALPTGAADAS
jgi:DNA-binding MarR family transcriptional regulator